MYKIQAKLGAIIFKTFTINTTICTLSWLFFWKGGLFVFLLTMLLLLRYKEKTTRMCHTSFIISVRNHALPLVYVLVVYCMGTISQCEDHADAVWPSQDRINDWKAMIDYGVEIVQSSCVYLAASVRSKRLYKFRS